MAFTKVFGTTAGVYATATNWQVVSVRNAAYAWTASGSGTNEYYLRTAGGANPGFAAQPTSVYINAASATEGTVGSLTAGQWDYGDNDTLGYSTIYVRLSDGTDPDSKSADYVAFYQIPQAGEKVIIPVTAFGVIAGSDQSAVAIGDFITEQEWTGAIGSATSYLRLDPDRLEWGGGEGYIDIGGAAIPVSVKATATVQPGYKALYLRGTAVTTLDVLDGSVGFAGRAGDLATATTVRVLGGDVLIGDGATLTTLDIHGGNIELRTNATTINIYSGVVELGASSAVTTINLYGGEVRYGSTGNITTINQRGGTFDERYGGATRTVTTYNYYAGSLRRNKEAVTHTTWTAPQSSTFSASNS